MSNSSAPSLRARSRIVTAVLSAVIAIVPSGLPSASALPEVEAWRSPVPAQMLASPAAPTAALAADFRFRGNLAAGAGSLPMTSISGTTFVSDTLGGLDCTVLRFEAGSGLQITSTAPVSSADFSVALLFRFDTVTGYRRILDLRNNTSDNGLYVFGEKLVHFPLGLAVVTSSVPADTYVQMVFTRKGADSVTRGYVDGVEQFAFVDAGGAATILSSTLRLFKDAAVPALNEESGGYIARARLWNGSLTPAEVAGLNRIEPGQCDPELSAVPDNAAVGGTVHLRAYGLPTAVSGYYIGLNPGVSGADTDLSLGVSPDANGYLSATVTLPAGAPTGAGWIGLQTINALVARPDSPAAGSGCPTAINYYDLCVPFTVNPTPTLALSPASARVGQTVRFTATNLVAGQARLSIAGASVFAAGRVSAGTLTGTFILAASPGLAYGVPATVTLQNLRAGTLAGSATAMLTPLTATPAPSYSVRSFVADFTPNSSGLITLTGIISPAPALEFLGGAQFNPMWHNAGVPPFPLTPVGKNLNPDGSFVVTVMGPSLYSGDAGTPQDNPAIGMNVVIDTLATTISSTFSLTANLKLTIQTFSGTLSTPTAAYVALESRGERQVSIQTCQDGQAAKQIGKRELIQNRVDPLINLGLNQLDFYARGTRLAGNPAGKVSNGATPKAHTTPGGELQLDLPAEIIDMDVSPSQGTQLFGSAVPGGLGLSRPSNAAGLEPAAPEKAETCVNSSGGNGIYEYRLLVTKPYLGIQPSDNMSPAPGGQPGFVHHYFAYTGLDGVVQFNTKLAANKLSIDTHPPGSFVPMASPYKVVLTLTEVYTIDNAHDALWSGFTLYQPQAMPSVSSVSGKESKNGAQTLTAKLGPGLKEILGQGLDGAIPVSPLDLYFDMENDPDGGGKVANASVRVLNPTKQVIWQSAATVGASGGGIRVSATMTDWRRTLASGTHQVEFVLHHPDFPSTIPHTVTNLALYAEALPRWFLQEYPNNRSITVNALGQIELYGEKAPPARIDRTPATALAALGQPANNSGVDTVKMTAFLDAAGTFRNKPQNGVGSNSIGANGGGGGFPALPGLSEPMQPEASADILDDVAGVAAGGPIKLRAATCTKLGLVPCVGVKVGATTLGEYVAGPERINVIDTGWLPLYRDQWGIWPIASAEVGVDYSVVGNLTALADLDISKDGIDYSSIYVEPDASAGVDVWLNLSVIAGLVEAEIHAVPQIGMDIGLTVTNIQLGSPTVVPVAGFWYQVDAKYHACLAWCLKETEGVQNIVPYGCVYQDGTSSSQHYPCRAPIPLSRPEVVTLPPRTAPFLTVAPSGKTMQIWQRESDGYLVSAMDGGGHFAPANVILASTVGSRPQAAFIGPSRAVAVWRHATNVGPGANFTQAVASQSIRFATWNGNTGAWSAHQLVSAPAGGAGAPVIAGYFNPASGASEAVAAWTVDMVSGGDLAARNTRVYWTRYRDGMWQAAQLADPAGSPGESQPFVTYGSDGVATLAWLKGTSNLGAPQNRRIAFRRLDGVSSAVSPGALPGGVYEFSLAANGATLNFAYTLIQASDQASQTAYTGSALIGDRKYLYAGSWSGSAWVERRLRDQYGRSIKAESPTIALTKGANANISFRQIGIGATSAGAFVRKPADPAGIALGSGELAQLNFAFTAKSFNAGIDALNAKVNYLTSDGALNWKPSAVYNPILGKTVVSAVSGPAPGGFASRKEGSAAAQIAQRAFLDEPIALAETEALPDIELVSVGVSTPYPTLTTTLILTAVVRNNGADLDAGFGLDAAWGLPPGAGQLAGTKAITALTTGETVTVSLVLTLPANVNVTNTLYVQLNTGGAVLESDGSNNVQTLVAGGLPPPAKVTASAVDNNPLIFVDWVQTRFDPRIVGWRVYRSEDGQAWAPAGSTFVDGWVDVAVEYGKGYLYRVASYDAYGNESPLSASVAAAGPAYTMKSVFIPNVRR